MKEMNLAFQTSIYDLTPEDMKLWLSERNHPAFHSKQIMQWLYHRCVRSFDEMTNVSKTLREQLQESFFIEDLPVVVQQEDKNDGTIKTLFSLRDGEQVEAVLMPQYAESVKTDPRSGSIKNRNTIKIKGYTTCLTTQVGCMFACRFCASGQKGLKRNMSPGEIVAQVMTFNRLGNAISRIVFMGTGEPLHNMHNLKRAIDILTAKDGLGLSSRRLTVSTVGLVPEIYRMAHDDWKVKLAISLHATTDEKRAEIMPFARAYQLDQLKDAIQYYQRGAGRRISFEYLMMGGVNDSRKDAERLLRYCDGLICHVNLIPFNPVSKSTFRPTSHDRIQEFKNCLRRGKIDVTVRYSRGRNIDAACGQLRLRYERESLDLN